jgi:hypothetical protein
VVLIFYFFKHFSDAQKELLKQLLDSKTLTKETREKMLKGLINNMGNLNRYFIFSRQHD